jgi:phosphate transport system substrate-binding protein
MNRSNRFRTFLMPAAAMIVVLTASLFAPGRGFCAAGAGKEIRIGGTGTGLGTMKLLSQAFQKEYPDIAITVYPSLGSAGGIKALFGGDLDIAVSSLDLTAAERAQGLAAIEYGKTPFVFVTHNRNRTSQITLKQAVDIFNGKATVWPDETPIRLILRPKLETQTKILQSMSEEMRRAVQQSYTRSGLNVAITDQENADLLERLPGSFGTSTLCQIISENRSLNILSLNGIKPSVKNLAGGAYPYFRVLYLVTRPKSSPLVRQFMDFVFSPAGQSILAKTGHLVTKRPK